MHPWYQYLRTTMYHTFSKYHKRKEYSLHHKHYLIYVFTTINSFGGKLSRHGVAAEIDYNVEHICLDSIQKKWKIIIITDHGCNNFVYKGLSKKFPYSEFSGPYFPTFGLNRQRYKAFFRIQSECWKILIRKTANTDTFHAGMEFSGIHQNIKHYTF